MTNSCSSNWPAADAYAPDTPLPVAAFDSRHAALAEIERRTDMQAQKRIEPQAPLRRRRERVARRRRRVHCRTDRRNSNGVLGVTDGRFGDYAGHYDDVADSDNHHDPASRRRNPCHQWSMRGSVLVDP